jgi:hypothetical protein
MLTPEEARNLVRIATGNKSYGLSREEFDSLSDFEKEKAKLDRVNISHRESSESFWEEKSTRKSPTSLQTLRKLIKEDDGPKPTSQERKDALSEDFIDKCEYLNRQFIDGNITAEEKHSKLNAMVIYYSKQLRDIRGQYSDEGARDYFVKLSNTVI